MLSGKTLKLILEKLSDVQSFDGQSKTLQRLIRLNLNQDKSIFVILTTSDVEFHPST
jgi:hypothetical protein